MSCHGRDNAPSLAAARGSQDDGPLEQKLIRWDHERRKLIKAGVLRPGLLIDFDYTTDLDLNLPIVSGD